MKTEITVFGKTVEEAIEKAVEELGAPSAEAIAYTVVEEPKKGLFGIGAAEAKVRVFIPETPAIRAVEFLEKLIENMRLNASVVVVSETEEEVCLNVVGQGLGALIGRRGDVLDSVQYLATLSANLGSHPVCMSPEAGMSFEMEKYMKRVNPEFSYTAGRILELNAEHDAVKAMQKAMTEDPLKAKDYAQLLCCQAQLMADLPLEDPAAYTELVCKLMK
mgnify:CR=1 FL=1